MFLHDIDFFHVSTPFELLSGQLHNNKIQYGSFLWGGPFLEGTSSFYQKKCGSFPDCNSENSANMIITFLAQSYRHSTYERDINQSASTNNIINLKHMNNDE